MHQSLWRRWFVTVAIGESLAFCLIPALGGALAWWATGGMGPSSRALILYGVAIVAGFGEGALLAVFQSRVLAEEIYEFPKRRWLLGTSLAAGAAWAAGTLAPTLDDLVGLATWAQIAIWIPAGIFILLSIGGVQTLILKGVIYGRQSRWLTANVIGWLLGLPWTFVLPMLMPDDAPGWIFGVAMGAGGILMAITVAAITGMALVTLLREDQVLGGNRRRMGPCGTAQQWSRENR
jgi:hypothetical protein